MRAHTKASASCGTCSNLVENVMKATLGDAFAKKAEGMCPCTSLDHGTVRRAIKAKGLKSIPAVMQELEWSTPEGCAKCRPALNYYLVASWPGEYADDQRVITSYSIHYTKLYECRLGQYRHQFKALHGLLGGGPPPCLRHRHGSYNFV